jgi:hypothetical protein
LFFLSGALAIVPIIYVWLRVPESVAWLEQQQRSRDLFVPRSSAPVKSLLSGSLLRSTLLATTACALALTAYWRAMAWLPTFLVQERGLDSSKMASFMAVLHVVTFIGYNLFGWLADRIGKRCMIIVSLVGCDLMLPVYTLATNHTALLLLGPIFAFLFAFFRLVWFLLCGAFSHASSTIRRRILLQRRARSFCFCSVSIGIGCSRIWSFFFHQHRPLRRVVPIGGSGDLSAAKWSIPEVSLPRSQKALRLPEKSLISYVLRQTCPFTSTRASEAAPQGPQG